MSSLFRTLFPRRLSRIPYSIRLVLLVGVVGVVYYYRGLTDSAANAIMLLVWIYIAFFVVLPRARDCGMPFIWAILALVPLFFPFLAVSLMFRSPEYRFSQSS